MEFSAIQWAISSVALLITVVVLKFLMSLVRSIFKAVILFISCAAVMGVSYLGFMTGEKVSDTMRDVSAFVTIKSVSLKKISEAFDW